LKLDSAVVVAHTGAADWRGWTASSKTLMLRGQWVTTRPT
jgi:hypothetical protein